MHVLSLFCLGKREQVLLVEPLESSAHHRMAFVAIVILGKHK